MNDNNELDALLATIEAGLETGWYAADVWEESNDKLKAGKAALATLREKLATMEEEREALREFKAQIEQSARPHMAMSPERFSRDVHAILKAHKQS